MNQNNTLTLHHILPYLPFGLEAKTKKESYANAEFGKITSWQGSGHEDEQIVIDSENGYYLTSIADTVPLLYSLDECFDLASPFIMNNTDWDITIAEEVSDFANYKKSLLQCSYAAIQAMAEAHIDMFRLIDAGLAVKKD